MKFQIFIHSIGDRGIRTALDKQAEYARELVARLGPALGDLGPALLEGEHRELLDLRGGLAQIHVPVVDVVAKFFDRCVRTHLPLAPRFEARQALRDALADLQSPRGQLAAARALVAEGASPTVEDAATRAGA